MSLLSKVVVNISTLLDALTHSVLPGIDFVTQNLGLEEAGGAPATFK